MEDLIPLYECCQQLGVETSFVLLLEEHGLIHTITSERTIYVRVDELVQLEKMVRLHTELEINLPGIEAVSHLLLRIEALQSEINQLHNRLRRYE